MEKKSETIVIVGLGYVGLPLALLADQKGCKVIGVDIDSRKIDPRVSKELRCQNYY